MPKISIIIATYNADKYLERCLSSIIVQKTEHVELIVIDGASKDKTVDIIKKYSSSIDYWISEKDDGVYSAWNKGIKQSTGDWMQFIGADDIYLPKALKEYQDFMDSNNLNEIDIISAKSEYVNKEGRILQYRGSSYSWDKLKKYMCMSHGSILHNKNLFSEIGYYNDRQYNICADYELLLRKKDKLKALFFDKPVIRMQAGGLSFTIKGQLETFKIKKDHKTTSMLSNYYLLFRGILGFSIKKTIWRV